MKSSRSVLINLINNSYCFFRTNIPHSSKPWSAPLFLFLNRLWLSTLTNAKFYFFALNLLRIFKQERKFNIMQYNAKITRYPNQFVFPKFSISIIRYTYTEIHSPWRDGENENNRRTAQTGRHLYTFSIDKQISTGICYD